MNLRRIVLIASFGLGVFLLGFFAMFVFAVEFDVSDAFHLSEHLVFLAPILQSVADAFRFVDSTVSPIVRSPFLFSDMFHFKEAIAVSVDHVGNNPFVTSGTTSQNFLFFNNQSQNGILITVIGSPVAFILGVFFVAWKNGLVVMAILLPILLFLVGGLAWIGIWPSYLILILIMLAAGGLTMVFLQFLYGGMARSTEG